MTEKTKIEDPSQILLLILKELEKLNAQIEKMRTEIKAEFESLSSDVRSVL